MVRSVDDARPPHHSQGLSSWVEEQGGYTGEARTRDAGWIAPVPELVTRSLADHLAATGVFVRVRVGEKAEPGELVLTARLRRLFGWQAYRVEPETGEGPRLLESLGDVYLDEVEVVDPGTGRLGFLGQAGASLREAPRLDPYALARAALDSALNRLAAAVAEADLGRRLQREVHLEGAGDLTSLPAAVPGSWEGRLGGQETPHGWTGDPLCRRLAFVDPSRTVFLPRLGHYHPFLDLWACPPGWAGRMRLGGEGAVAYPAEILGLTPDGTAVLVRQLGPGSWPDARGEVFRWLGLTTPPDPLSLPPDP